MKRRLTILNVLMIVVILYEFVGGFIAHWFFPDLYMHRIMGFSGYQDSLLKLLGVFGVVLSFQAYLVIRNPLRNRDIVRSIILLGFLTGVSFVYFVLFGDFPLTETINAGASIALAVVLWIVYPWKEAAD